MLRICEEFSLDLYFCDGDELKKRRWIENTEGGGVCVGGRGGSDVHFTTYQLGEKLDGEKPLAGDEFKARRRTLSGVDCIFWPCKMKSSKIPTNCSAFQDPPLKFLEPATKPKPGFQMHHPSGKKWGK